MNIYKLLIAFILFTTIELDAQVRTEQVDYNYRIAYCVGTANSTAWIGEDVVVMIEGETPNDRDSSLMATIVSTFEDIISKYESITGLTNLTQASSYLDKPVIEVVQDNCGAGGLASHGVLGMSTGTYFLDEFYDLVSQGNISVPQVFLYELNRNFWLAGMDGFNGKFDWAMNNELQNYGWWTVGMNNAQAYIIPKLMDIGMYYFGNDLNYWEQRMVGELEAYMNDPQYDFEFGWKQSLMPWHNTESINDLMSGLIIYSFNNFGGEKWIKGFYEHIQNDDIMNRPGVFAFQECRDNIYKIWSYAAEQDLITFFKDDLRWIITDEAETCVQEYLEISDVQNMAADTGEINIYPNPVSNNLHIESNSLIDHPILIHDAQGQVIERLNSTARMTHHDISELPNGIYLITIGKRIFRITKV